MKNFLWLFLMLVEAGIAVERVTDPKIKAGCSSTGLQPHPTDCHKFLSCTLIGANSYEVKEGRCPQGIFSRNLRTCVPESKISCREWPLALSSLWSTPEEDPECPDLGISCTRDCRSIKLCFRNNNNRLQSLNMSCEPYFCRNGFCSYQHEPNSCVQYQPPKIAESLSLSASPPSKRSPSKASPESSSFFQCGHNGTFPDYRNCRKFFVCDSRLQASWKSCPAGKMFNPRTSTCNLLHSQEQCSSMLLPRDVCSGSSCGFHPYLHFCRLYYFCQPSRANRFQIIPVLYQCPEKQGFDTQRGICDVLDPNRDCAENNRTVSCRKTGFLQVPSQRCSSRYLFCYPDTEEKTGSLKALELECNNGHIFDPEQEKCAHFNAVKSCRPSCRNKPPGFHRIPADCAAYYVCVNKRDQPITYMCPKGLVFNMDIQQCDFIDNVPYCTTNHHHSSSVLY